VTADQQLLNTNRKSAITCGYGHWSAKGLEEIRNIRNVIQIIPEVKLSVWCNAIERLEILIQLSCVKEERISRDVLIKTL
jgi:hypothetical protein